MDETGYMLNALETTRSSRTEYRIEVELVETIFAQSSTDAAGLRSARHHHAGRGHRNAFYNATGVRMRKIPMTPANVLAVLGKVSEEETDEQVCVRRLHHGRQALTE